MMTFYPLGTRNLDINKIKNTNESVQEATTDKIISEAHTSLVSLNCKESDH